MEKPHAHRLRKGRISETNRIYFLTTSTSERKPVFSDFKYARQLIGILRGCTTMDRAQTICFVVMPDHLHWLMQLNEGQNLSEEILERLRFSLPDKPERMSVSTTVFIRNPAVVAEALARAKGICESCNTPAPFKRKSNGEPYLEVHHIKPLSEGGSDTKNNVMAICPNCHKRKHFG